MTMRKKTEKNRWRQRRYRKHNSDDDRVNKKEVDEDKEENTEDKDGKYKSEDNCYEEGRNTV